MSLAIIPSLLFADQASFVSHLTGLGSSVEMVQIDIADGRFVPQQTWADPTIIQSLLTMRAELHLMVSDPFAVANAWKDVLQVTRLLAHYESMRDVTSTIRLLRSLGRQVNLVLNPETPVDAIEPHIDAIDGVMLMGVHPGRQGQSFIPETLTRIRMIKTRHPSLFVEVDGGVNAETLPSLIAAGTDAVCPGSAIFDTERTPQENVRRMRALVDRLTTGTRSV